MRTLTQQTDVNVYAQEIDLQLGIHVGAYIRCCPSEALVCGASCPARRERKHTHHETESTQRREAHPCVTVRKEKGARRLRAPYLSLVVSAFYTSSRTWSSTSCCSDVLRRQGCRYPPRACKSVFHGNNEAIWAVRY